jgi:hemolysin D
MTEAAKSSHGVVPFPDKRLRRRDHELAFLPAALEIVETPPSPIGRAIGATIIMVFVLALAWACLGTVDIVATASGKIIPSGRSKVLQPFEIGVVRAIRVHDGDTVKAGDVLIELDPTMNTAEREHLQSDLIAAQLDVARLHAALADGADPLADFYPPALASPPVGAEGGRACDLGGDDRQDRCADPAVAAAARCAQDLVRARNRVEARLSANLAAAG